jgi:hypothetical protein
MDCPFDTTPKIPEKIPDMIILRGIPGAGKTTIAEICFPNFVKCSADDHFMVNGKYIFNRYELQLAHDNCFAKAFKNLKAGKSVIIDNTNGKISDFARYLKIRNVNIIVLTVTTCFQNVHNVPQVVIDNFELEKLNNSSLKALNIKCKIGLQDVRLCLETKILHTKYTYTSKSDNIFSSSDLYFISY